MNDMIHKSKQPTYYEREHRDVWKNSLTSNVFNFKTIKYYEIHESATERNQRATRFG